MNENSNFQNRTLCRLKCEQAYTEHIGHGRFFPMSNVLCGLFNQIYAYNDLESEVEKYIRSHDNVYKIPQRPYQEPSFF